MDRNRVHKGAVDFSLLLPTRGRVALVQRLLASLVETTADPHRVEVVFYVDEDDHESREISHPDLSLIKIVGLPGETMGNMNRACYDASHGRYVMLVNDDAVFRTSGWDHRVLEIATGFPDQIALIYGNDLDQGEVVPTFPIVSRAMCDVLGELCPRGYQNLHIESHLLDIFNQLARLGHRRICYLDDVVIEHMHHSIGKSVPDLTSIKKNQRADDLLFIALDEERAFKAKILAQYIETVRKHHSMDSYTRHFTHVNVQPKASLIGLLKRIFFLS